MREFVAYTSHKIAEFLKAAFSNCSFWLDVVELRWSLMMPGFRGGWRLRLDIDPVRSTPGWRGKSIAGGGSIPDKTAESGLDRGSQSSGVGRREDGALKDG